MNRGIKVLQTFALPLGHGAEQCEELWTSGKVPARGSFTLGHGTVFTNIYTFTSFCKYELMCYTCYMKIQTIVGHFSSNTFVVEHLGRTVIIDAGAPIEKVKKALNDKQPDAVLVTHSHFDHVHCLKDYRANFRCPVFTPTDNKEIVLEKLVIKPILCPGHSPDSVVYQIEDCLFTGDVLFEDTIGRTDLTADAKRATPQIIKENEKLMQQSLKRLAGVKFKMAYHGHGDPSTYEKQIENIKWFIANP